MSYDVYISSKINKDFKRVVSVAKKQKLNIEIKTFVKNRNLDDLENIVPVYKDILKNFNGKLSMHGAFAGLSPVAYSMSKRKRTIHRFNQTIEVAKELNAKVIVFHSGIDTFPGSYYEDADFIKWFTDSQVEFWSEYIKRLGNTGITAVLENTSERSPDVLRTIVEKVNSASLKQCIDVGHVNHKTDYNVSEWLERTGENLYYMHLHNNYKLLDDHNSLLKGTIDFNKVFKTLKKLDRHPGLSLEISDYNAAMESLDFLRNQLDS